MTDLFAVLVGLSSARSFPEKILHVGEPNLLIVAAGLFCVLCMHYLNLVTLCMEKDLILI